MAQPSTHPSHARNTSLNSSHPMSRTGTNQSTHSQKQSPPSQAMARSHTNTSSAPTPTPMARQVTSSGVSAVESPAAKLAVERLFGEIERKGTTPGGGGGNAGGLTPGPLGAGVGKAGGSSIAGLGIVEAEEERRRRVGLMRDLLATRWGIVGQEGVERCARRCGLECLWEGEAGQGRRVLSIAGEGLLVEVDFVGDAVKKVGLDFPGMSMGDGEKVKGGEVLGRSLMGDGEGEYKRLEAFAGNLERLGRMDRAGGGAVNCFDAVDGVGKSLDMVFEKEVEHERRQGRERPTDDAMCGRTGRPAMHARGRVGLALQFWKDQRLVTKQTVEDAMELDEPAGDEADDEADQLYSAMIECESCPTELYSSVRISRSWVRQRLDSAIEVDALHISDTDLEWLEPPGDIQTTSTTDIGESKHPNARFMARLEPQLVVSLPAAITLLESVGFPIPQENIMMTNFETLVFANTNSNSVFNTPHTLQNGAPNIYEKAVTSYNATTETSTTHQHQYTLYTPARDFARTLSDLPFRHPMQIINLLPHLRQWALVGSILRRTLTAPGSADADPPSQQEPGTTQNDDKVTNGTSPDQPSAFQSLEDELADFLSSPSPAAVNGSKASRSINITFSASPLPQFTVQFPNPNYAGKRAAVQFAVGLNGTIQVLHVDDGGPPAVISGMEDDVDADNTGAKLREKVKKVLEVSEDIGVMVEWFCGHDW
ncbi:MAG: hypothetical protein OHK93_000675 [Ramalina farinacea]|uniref:Mediator of RNA polymerase II transcription subunit 1 n=1 Tax=Ramalina farinacea TaxID=258253 RepID=A0AA43TVB6_9LECA|nr:hypothetical protein [Ramalina farinacea]